MSVRCRQPSRGEGLPSVITGEHILEASGSFLSSLCWSPDPS